MCSKNYIKVKNKKIKNTQIIALNYEMPIGAIIVRCNNISNDEKRNDYGCLVTVRYIIKHTPVHTDTHDHINLILVNEILLFNMILVLEYQCL